MTELTGDLVTTGDRPVVMAWEHLLPLLTDAEMSMAITCWILGHVPLSRYMYVKDCGVYGFCLQIIFKQVLR